MELCGFVHMLDPVGVWDYSRYAAGYRERKADSRGLSHDKPTGPRMIPRQLTGNQRDIPFCTGCAAESCASFYSRVLMALKGVWKIRPGQFSQHANYSTCSVHVRVSCDRKEASDYNRSSTFWLARFG